MKKNIILVLAILLQVGFTGIAGAASYDDYSLAPRVAAMGGASAALPMDAAGVMFNPSSIAQEKNVTIAAAYSALYAGLLTDSVSGEAGIGAQFVALSVPIDKYVKVGKSIGTVGLSFKSLQVNNLTESAVGFSYARGLNDLIDQKGVPPISLGVSVKYYMSGLKSTDYFGIDPALKASESVSAPSFDVGVMSTVMQTLENELRIGVAAQDLNSPTLGNSTDTVPLKIKGGVSFMRLTSSVPVTVAVDVNYSMEDTAVLTFNGGLEALLMKKALAVRVGGNNNEATLGFGYKMKGISADYAFIYPLAISGSAGSHKFGLGYSF